MVLFAGLKEASRDFVEQVCQQSFAQQESVPCGVGVSPPTLRSALEWLNDERHAIVLSVLGVKLDGSQKCTRPSCNVIEFSTCIYRYGETSRTLVKCFQYFFDPFFFICFLA